MSCIYGDKYFEVYFILYGMVDLVWVMCGVDCLMMIVGVLSEVYEKVLIECGLIDGCSVEWLMCNDNVEIVLLMLGVSEEKIVCILVLFEVIGCDEVIFMSNSLLFLFESGDS